MYIDKLPQIQNVCVSYGTHCRSVLERWAKGEMTSFELADVYTAEYDEAVKEYFPPFPRGLAGKNYEEGLQRFKSFDDLGDHSDILSAEDKLGLDIRGNRFVGITDMITVIAHKSKSMQSPKRKLLRIHDRCTPMALM